MEMKRQLSLIIEKWLKKTVLDQLESEKPKTVSGEIEGELALIGEKWDCPR